MFILSQLLISNQIYSILTAIIVYCVIYVYALTCTDYISVFAKVVPYIILVDLMLAGFYLYTRRNEDSVEQETPENEGKALVEVLKDTAKVDDEDASEVLEISEVLFFEPDNDPEPIPKIEEIIETLEETPKHEIPIKSKKGRKTKKNVEMKVIPEETESETKVESEIVSV